MKSLSTQHQRQVLNNLLWVVFWGVLSIALYNHKDSFHWIVYVYLAVSIILLVGRMKATWPAYQFGKHQALLRYKQEVPTGNHGSAGFANEAEMEGAGLFDPNNGIPIGFFNGRPLFYRPIHALCVAPAGSGKGISIAIPAKAHSYRIPLGNGTSEAASTVVTDLKGELAAMTAKLSTKQHGHKVYYLNPDNLYGLGNVKFNPLQMIVNDIAHPPFNKYAMADAKELAMQLIPEPPEGDKNAFFRHGSRNIIIALMLWLAIDRAKCCTLSELFRVISSAERLKEELNRAMESDGLSGDIALLASGLLETSDDHLSDFITGALQAVMPFSPSGPLADSVSYSEFMFEILKQERVTVYIIARYDRKDVYAPWMGLIAKCANKSLIRTEGNVPVHFLLDEATNIPLPSLASDLTALRGYGLRAHIICQSKSELRRVYGKDATETFYSQTDLKQFFGVSSFEEAKEISDMIGSFTVKAETLGADQTSPWSNLKNSVGETGRPLLMPDELLRLPKDEQIILIKDLPPIKCKRLPYHYVPEWHAMIDDNPLEGGKLPLDAKVSIFYQEARA